VHHHDLAYCGIFLLEFFKSFAGWHCSQIDGYHDDSTFPSFVCCGKLGETLDAILLTFDYDVKVVIPLLMV
jgi:hypothetical protein